jgi:hypothetical protein
MAIRTELTDAMTVAGVIDETIFFGINANTLNTDVRAWDMWERVCRAQGTSPLRSAAEARDFPERNAHLLACLLLHAFAVGRPRDRSRAFIPNATVVGDQHMAALTSEFSQLKAAAEIQAYEQALRVATDPFSPRDPPRGARPAALSPTRAASPEVPEPVDHPVTLEPIQETPMPGAELAVGRHMWPDYPCDELHGLGWKVLVLSATPATATIRFTHARLRGRRYEDTQVQTSSLLLIKPLYPLDQQGP